MASTDKVVLVTGATGRQGGAVVRHMLAKSWKLRALTRRPKAYEAQTLARQGVQVVQGDLEDPVSIARAAEGVYGIYSVQDFWSVGANRGFMSILSCTWRYTLFAARKPVSVTAGPHLVLDFCSLNNYKLSVSWWFHFSCRGPRPEKHLRQAIIVPQSTA